MISIKHVNTISYSPIFYVLFRSYLRRMHTELHHRKGIMQYAMPRDIFSESEALPQSDKIDNEIDYEYKKEF